MIYVELGTSFLDYPEATYELGIGDLRTVVRVEGYEDDTYEDVARGMCRALALLGFRGEVGLFYDGMAGGEEKREILATIDSLKGELRLTGEGAERAAAEEQQRHKRELAWFSKTASFIKQEGLRRGLPKEEREKLTLREALEDSGE